jgi:hypothetical protein
MTRHIDSESYVRRAKPEESKAPSLAGIRLRLIITP